MADHPFNVVERPDLVPVCSFCNLDLHEIHMQKRGFPLFQGQTMIFFCPHCKKVLGFGQGRMA